MEMRRKVFMLVIPSLAAACLMAVAWAAPVKLSAAAGSADAAFGIAPSAGMTDTVHVTGTHGITNVGQAMIASAIAAHFGVSIDEVMKVRDQDLGWGEVFKVFLYAQLTGKTADDIIALRDDDMGWGEIAKSLGLHPGHGKDNLGQTIKEHGATPTPTPAVSNPNTKPKNDNGNHGNPNNGNHGRPADKPDNGKPDNPGRGNGH
jgi:hypothetical protein